MSQRMGIRAALALASLLLPGVAVTAQAPVALYQVTDIGTVPGLGDVQAYALSEDGQVTGTITQTPGATAAYHLFLWSGGVLKDLGALGSQGADGKGINSAGQIAGHTASSGGYKTFLWSNGKVTNIVSKMSHAWAINQVGQVAGESSGAPWIWQGGRLTSLPTFGKGLGCSPKAINAGGNCAGSATVLGPGTSYNRAALWAGGRVSELGTLGGDHSEALGMNDANVIVGDAYTPTRELHAALFVRGEVRDLGTLPGSPSGSYAKDINNSNVAVGFARVPDASPAGFKVRAVIWRDSDGDGLPDAAGIQDLNNLVDTAVMDGWELFAARAINDNGQILCAGQRTINGVTYTHSFLLSP